MGGRLEWEDGVMGVGPRFLKDGLYDVKKWDSFDAQKQKKNYGSISNFSTY